MVFQSKNQQSDGIQDHDDGLAAVFHPRIDKFQPGVGFLRGRQINGDEGSDPQEDKRPDRCGTQQWNGEDHADWKRQKGQRPDPVFGVDGGVHRKPDQDPGSKPSTGVVKESSATL